MQLVIGAGERRIPGFVHHDVQKLKGIDIVCDFWKLPGHVLLGSCSEIHMTHVLEHFPMAKTHEALTLIWGLLAKGGRLYLEVPNFHWQCQQIVMDAMNRKVVEYAYGGQHNKWDFHYNGFTPEILIDDMLETGFRMDELKPNSSIESWWTKV